MNIFQATIQQLANLSDMEVFQHIEQQVIQGAQLGDFIQLLIMKSVPLYLITKTQNTVLEKYGNQIQQITFGISESVWRNNINNLQSNISSDYKFAYINKSHIIESQLQLLVCKFDQSNLAVLINHNQNGLTWSKKKEPRTTFTRTTMPPIHHYTIKGNVPINQEMVFLIPISKYRRLAAQLPLREICGFSIVAYYFLKKDASISTEIQHCFNQLIGLRKENKLLTRKVLPQCRKIISAYINHVGIKSIHPFWQLLKH